jgi:hypothetical protein
MGSFRRDSCRHDHVAYAHSAPIIMKKNGMEKRMMPMGERGAGEGGEAEAERIGGRRRGQPGR